MAGASKLKWVLLSGLLVRLALAPFFAHPFDVFGWYTAGTNALGGRVSLGEFLAPYQYSYFLFVFPGTLLFDALTRYVPSFSIPLSTVPFASGLEAQWGVTMVPGILFDFLVKLPLILSDTLVALLLYRMVARATSNPQLGASAAALWYLNPGVIWVTAGWGMFDTLPALFTVLFFYLFVERRYLLSGAMLAFAVALKYYAAVLLVPLLLYSKMRRHGSGVLASLLGALAPGALLAVPAVLYARPGASAELPGQFSTLLSGVRYILSGPSPHGLHYSGLSFWTAITLFHSDFNQTLVSNLALVAAVAAAYLLVWKRPTKTVLGDAAAFVLPLLCVLLLYRSVHENFFLWALPFLAILSVENPRLRRVTWLLGTLVFASSITESLLPYYMLPMYPWIGSQLAAAFAWMAPYQVAPHAVVQGFCCGGVLPGISLGKVVLAAMGLASALLLLLALVEVLGVFGVRPDLRSWLRENRIVVMEDEPDESADGGSTLPRGLRAGPPSRGSPGPSAAPDPSGSPDGGPGRARRDPSGSVSSPMMRLSAKVGGAE